MINGGREVMEEAKEEMGFGQGMRPGKLKIAALTFSDIYLQRSRPWKIN
jgi:hypothetical protein